MESQVEPSKFDLLEINNTVVITRNQGAQHRGEWEKFDQKVRLGHKVEVSFLLNNSTATNNSGICFKKVNVSILNNFTKIKNVRENVLFTST